jgi:hypothetical protein
MCTHLDKTQLSLKNECIMSQRKRLHIKSTKHASHVTDDPEYTNTIKMFFLRKKTKSIHNFKAQKPSSFIVNVGPILGLKNCVVPV